MFSGASNLADGVDRVFVLIFVLSAAFLVSITGVMVFFVLRYGRARHPKARQIAGNATLEVTWTAIPLVLFSGMFMFGWSDWKKMREPPPGAATVQAIARQWSWSFVYPGGKVSDELVLPVDKPVRLDLKSEDVIHGFYVPAFRVKQDVVPGKSNFLWFTPTRAGGYDIECTVNCGVRHSRMLSRVNVVGQAEFEKWLSGSDGKGPKGLAVMKNKGCVACHSTDGTKVIGPSFKGIYGAPVTVMTGGLERTLTVDDEYIRRSIRSPMADIVKGFPPVMPPQQLTEAEIADVIDFIRALK
jgi:cytochrome c oxidase subunit 2